MRRGHGRDSAGPKWALAAAANKELLQQTPHAELLQAANGIEVLEVIGGGFDKAIPTPVDKLQYAPFEGAIKDQLQRPGYAKPTPIQMLGVAPTAAGRRSATCCLS